MLRMQGVAFLCLAVWALVSDPWLATAPGLVSLLPLLFVLFLVLLVSSFC